MNRLLLCPPDFYGVRYVINPWMDPARGVDHSLAQSQWEQLGDLLVHLGCKVDAMSPDPDWPDMVFTANAGLVHGRQACLGQFRHAERQGESHLYKAWFAGHGFDVVHLPASLVFEGEGDALFCGDHLYCGHGFRTELEAHAELEVLLNCEVTSLRLTDPRFYHLDTCFCPLGPDEVAWYPDAFDSVSRDVVCRQIPHRIVVSSKEALCFACNAIVLGRDLVLPLGCPELARSLRARDFQPWEVPMGEFIKAGGACKCLVLCLDHPMDG